MTDISPKFSVRPERPVDPLLVDILKQVDLVAREQGIDYFVGGAMARDLILQHVFGKDTGRATRDVDFGVWQDLLESVGFDLEIAGTVLLGKDVAEICLPETARQISAMLAAPALRQRLVEQMLRHTLLSGDAAGSGRVVQYLDAFQKGFGPAR